MTFANQVLMFDSVGLEEDTLLITRLVGTERISGLYRFELELASAKKGLDLQKILDAPAKIGFREQIALAGGGTGWTTRWIAGELESFSYSHSRQGVSGYRAVLVPRLARLEETFRSRVFLDDHAPKLVTRLLDEAGLVSPDDYKLAKSIEDALKGDPTEPNQAPEEWKCYPRREYVVQYEETDLTFVSRWLEHEGIFYFFDHETPDRETLILADGPSSYKPVKGRATIPFKPEGATSHQDTPGIYTLSCAFTRPPKEVVLKDYNWRNTDDVHALEAPSEEIPNGRGVSYEYNYHFKTLAQGKHLANVRAEGLRARARVFSGRSDCRNLRAGHTFELTDHDRSDFNRSYLLTELRYEAEQDISLESRAVSGATFTCDFTAIPADETYRPEPETEWPAIRGVMHARIDDREADPTYADLDDFGRYKVTLPFDQVGAGRKSNERASRYMRMATPYVGSLDGKGGMHFPLRPGTDVLLTHIDGDPDRPLIAGAVPNIESGIVVDRSNQTRNRLESARGNVFEIEDEEGREGITIANDDGSSYMCFTKPGAMGAGGGGGGSSSGSGGAAEASRPTQASVGADLPGAGSGMGELVPDSAQTDDGAKGFEKYITYDNKYGCPPFQVSTVGGKEDLTDERVKEDFASVYSGASKTDVIDKLNGACSLFSGNVGVFKLVAGGPSVSALYGDSGVFAKGNTKITKEEFTDVTQDLDGSGKLTQRVGGRTRWKEIKRTIQCDKFISIIGPESQAGDGAFTTAYKAIDGQLGKIPSLVRDSKRGVVVKSELWATESTTFLKAAPISFNYDLSALRVDMKVGLQTKVNLGPQATANIGGQLVYNVAPTYELGIVRGDTWLTKGSIAASRTTATLKDDIARVKRKSATVSSVNARIKATEASIKSSTALINENRDILNTNAKVLSETIDVLNSNTKALNKSDKALNLSLAASSVKLGLPG